MLQHRSGEATTGQGRLPDGGLDEDGDPARERNPIFGSTAMEDKIFAVIVLIVVLALI